MLPVGVPVDADSSIDKPDSVASFDSTRDGESFQSASRGGTCSEVGITVGVGGDGASRGQRNG